MTGRAAAITLLALANLLAQPAKSKAPAKTAVVVIQGTLAGPDGVPLQLDATQLLMTFVFALPVPKEEEQSANIALRAEELNRFRAKPDEHGRFQLRVNRKDVPKGQQLRLLLMLPMSGAGMQTLMKDGQNILIDILTSPSNLNLGKVIVGSTPRNQVTGGWPTPATPGSLFPCRPA